MGIVGVDRQGWRQLFGLHGLTLGVREVNILRFNPLTGGAAHIRFLQFLLAYYISAFKPVKDKT